MSLETQEMEAPSPAHLLSDFSFSKTRHHLRSSKTRRHSASRFRLDETTFQTRRHFRLDETTFVFFLKTRRHSGFTADIYSVQILTNPFFRPKWLFQRSMTLHTAQMSVLNDFCGPHLPLAFQFLWLFAGYSTNSSFCWYGPLLETIVLFVWN